MVERTREIGAARALGITRRQLRQTVRLESVAISVYGAALGVLLGVAAGLSSCSTRWSRRASGRCRSRGCWSAIVLVLAAVVGVLAALAPARRAAKLDVLQAITSD